MVEYFLIGVGGICIGFLLGILAVAYAEACEESNRYDDDEWEDEDGDHI